MINHKGTVRIGGREHVADKAVGMFYLITEVFITLHVSFFIILVDGAQGVYNISGNNLRVVSGTPDMWFYTEDVVFIFLDRIVGMRFVVAVMVVDVRGIKNQIDTAGSIEKLQMRRVICQLIHPGLFKTDITDAEVSFTLGKIDKLLRSRIVRFRTATFGYHADNVEVISCNGFGEVA